MTLYDELDAVIDKIGKERPTVVKQFLRNIRDRLPDEIEEVTVVVNKEKVVSDVLLNGKPVHCYTVVPKDQLRKYLMGRGYEK
jgi:hypothetical protein